MVFRVRSICRCLGGWTLEDWRLERASRVLVRLFALCVVKNVTCRCLAQHLLPPKSHLGYTSITILLHTEIA